MSVVRAIEGKIVLTRSMVSSGYAPVTYCRKYYLVRKSIVAYFLEISVIFCTSFVKSTYSMSVVRAIEGKIVLTRSMVSSGYAPVTYCRKYYLVRKSIVAYFLEIYWANMAFLPNLSKAICECSEGVRGLGTIPKVCEGSPMVP
jgi:hypothetical protein